MYYAMNFGHYLTIIFFISYTGLAVQFVCL